MSRRDYIEQGDYKKGCAIILIAMAIGAILGAGLFAHIHNNLRHHYEMPREAPESPRDGGGYNPDEAIRYSGEAFGWPPTCGMIRASELHARVAARLGPALILLRCTPEGRVYPDSAFPICRKKINFS